MTKNERYKMEDCIQELKEIRESLSDDAFVVVNHVISVLRTLIDEFEYYIQRKEKKDA